MVHLNDQNPITTVDVKKTALYKKALYIYELSQKLCESYYSNSSCRSRILEDLVLLSIRLPYTISLAQTTPSYNTKLNSCNNILENIKRLKIQCEELKKLQLYNRNDIAFINKEIRNFTSLYTHWRLILTQQN